MHGLLYSPCSGLGLSRVATDGLRYTDPGKGINEGRVGEWLNPGLMLFIIQVFGRSKEDISCNGITSPVPFLAATVRQLKFITKLN